MIEASKRKEEMGPSHTPVMLEEVLSFLKPCKDEIYIDATFGLGGYSTALLEKGASKVIAIDRDEEATPYAQSLKERFKDRFEFIRGNFSNIHTLITYQNVFEVQGVVFDLGVSSPQIDCATRGFSFQKEGPLDMRMENSGLSAFDVIQEASEETLADIFYHYGEEKKSRRVARAILRARKAAPLNTTTDLVKIIHSVLGKKTGKIDSATRVFQALRIYVNDEIGALKKGLEGALNLLDPGGRLVVVTFHSLEDRIVKEFFNVGAGKLQNTYSRYIPHAFEKERLPLLSILTSKALHPQESEILQNPRARSAKLRAALRTQNPLLAERTC